MKGVGKTVMKGTHIETFEAEVLGVLRHQSPGRDLVLCRLSGLDLERIGVLAGMSGSPITIGGKLLGAVAYAWPYGKEPIAGITPFCQMHEFAAAFDERPKTEHYGLRQPLALDGQAYTRVAVGDPGPTPTHAAGELWLTPLRTPVATSGFSSRALEQLRPAFEKAGMVPVQGGAVGKALLKGLKTKLEPGSPLAVALVQGDFDMSGIGTVTHVDGERVYGWGHPFMSLGGCDIPLMTGYIHTVFPRQTVGFKMGSPMHTVGVVNADVSTGIAGHLGRVPDLLPVTAEVCHEPGVCATFNTQVVRQRSLVSALVFAVLSNSIDREGDLPEEMTADLHCTINVAGRAPLVIDDTLSGSIGGGRGPNVLFGGVGQIVNLLTYNPLEPIRIENIRCQTHIRPGRITADIESVELTTPVVKPGAKLRANVFVRPHRGEPFRVPVTLPIPSDLPEGTYTAVVCDEVSSARQDLRAKPYLAEPTKLDHLFEALRLQTAAKRTNLVVRVGVEAAGVSVAGQALPNLPPSMVRLIGQARRSGAQTFAEALTARTPTQWVLTGSESVKFVVSHTRTARAEE
jgi:hypothetical protein